MACDPAVVVRKEILSPTLSNQGLMTGTWQTVQSEETPPRREAV